MQFASALKTKAAFSILNHRCPENHGTSVDCFDRLFYIFLRNQLSHYYYPQFKNWVESGLRAVSLVLENPSERTQNIKQAWVWRVTGARTSRSQSRSHAWRKENCVTTDIPEGVLPEKFSGGLQTLPIKSLSTTAWWGTNIEDLHEIVIQIRARYSIWNKSRSSRCYPIPHKMHHSPPNVPGVSPRETYSLQHCDYSLGYPPLWT